MTMEPGLGDAGASAELQQQAAAAYARLLLQNKLKLQGMLAVVGEGIAGPNGKASWHGKHLLKTCFLH
jgi:hypothetical protein